MAGAVPDANTIMTIINSPENHEFNAPRITSYQKTSPDIIAFSLS